jgi:aminoglycoside 3-N-acetyltransferase
MQQLTRSGISDAIASAGICLGDIVYLQTDLRTLGMIKGARTREAFCGSYLEAIFDVLGRHGTLVVPTYTTQVARFDMDFIWEETPTLLGTFPEFIRRHPESLRSIHPLHSVTAIGARKALICADNGPSDFGWNSPYHRMLEAGAKLLTMGLESGYVVGISHHLDAACGLPYVYNKLLKWVPIVRGEPVKRHYFACVRHLDLAVSYHLRDFVKHMRSLGGVTSVRLGGGWVHKADYRRVFEEGARRLADDPYCMLKEAPRFTYGTVPFDGPTAGRDGLADTSDAQRLSGINWRGYYFDRGSPGGDDAELEPAR